LIEINYRSLEVPLFESQPILFLTTLGFILSLCLVLARSYLIVSEDPILLALGEMLPQSNCGACGCVSCRQFARRLVAGEVAPAGCTQSSDSEAQKIADYLNVDLGEVTKRVARLACQGGSNVARQRVVLLGCTSCSGANLVAGGGKGCTWGCLGYGDCEVVCHYDALHLDPWGLPLVDPTKCTACGDCLDACPKNLFSLVTVDQPLFVACKNLLEGEQAQADCMVACTGCGLCVKDAPPGQISVYHHLAVIDQQVQQTSQENKKAIGRCPTGAIGIWAEDGQFQKAMRPTKSPIKKFWRSTDET